MKVTFDPAVFAPLIEQAVSETFQQLNPKRHSTEPDKILLSKAEAADAMGVSQSTIDRWRRDEGLPWLKLEGAVVLFRPESLKAWAAQKETRNEG